LWNTGKNFGTDRWFVLIKVKSWFRKSQIIRAFNILPPGDKPKILAVSIIQILLGFLDLLGVLAIGLLGAISITGIQSKESDSRVFQILKILKLEDKPFQSQAITVAGIAIALLIGRTLLSAIFTRRILYFLSRRSAHMSANLVNKLLAQPLLVNQQRTLQETLFAVTTGVGVITVLVLANTIMIISDVSLLLILLVGLLLIDPATAMGTFCLFLLTALFLYKFLSVRAHALGIRSTELEIQSNNKVVEVFSTFREAIVHNRQNFYFNQIKSLRLSLAEYSSQSNFMPFVSKYVFEAVIVLGAMALGATQFLLHDTTKAVATISIFLAAGSRIVPAVLRVQQVAVQIRGGLGTSAQTLSLIESLSGEPVPSQSQDFLDTVHEGFIPKIEAKNLIFTYPNRTVPAVNDFSLSIHPGDSIAIVGFSGSGKTTIADLLLGIIDPDSGCVQISDKSPKEVFCNWPGAVSYVPQDVAIVNGTIRENIALGYETSEHHEDLLIDALKVAQLMDFIEELPEGLDTQAGENGVNLSGGQRQRLGIARALYTKPKILFLDEATSSLDAISEQSFAKALKILRETTTVVLIAHRLSLLQYVEKIVYISEGKLLYQGTYNEVLDYVPAFREHVQIMSRK